MKQIACIYFEGNDSKVTLFTKENDKLVLLKAESLDTSLAFTEKHNVAAQKSNGETNLKETIKYDFISDETSSFSRKYLEKINEFFYGEDINKCKFIPILGEPSIYFQKMNDEKEIADLGVNSKGKIDTTIGFIKLNDNSTLAVYPSGKSNYLQVLDTLAKLNNRKFLTIPTVKSAEISLALYILKKYKFNPLQSTLILYTGKEYSKLIFLKGSKIQQISPTLSIGKNSFNMHNVIVSKILLEMELAGLSKLDYILLCGEDETKNFINVISDAYPHSKVKTIKFDDVEINKIDSCNNASSFIVPIAVAEEYFSEVDKKYSGINLLPNYFKEVQKPFHLGWQSYLMIFLIFIVTLLFSFKVVSNKSEIQNKKKQINELLTIKRQNQETVNKIKSYENKIKNMDQTKMVLEQLSNGTGVFSEAVKKVADFVGKKRNLWISDLKLNADNNLQISGYTLSRTVARELSDSYKKSLLESIVYEPLRDYRAFKFLIDAGNNNLVKGGSVKK